jgi:hypothetical protein
VKRFINTDILISNILSGALAGDFVSRFVRGTWQVVLMIIPLLLASTAGCTLLQKAASVSYPTVCFLLPDNFVGAFQLVMDEKTGVDATFKDGCYTYEIPESGVLKVRTFQPLEQWHKEIAIYRNGEKVQPADSNTDPGAMALRGLGRSQRNDGPLTETLIIGTEEQPKQANRDLQDGILQPGQEIVSIQLT